MWIGCTPVTERCAPGCARACTDSGDVPIALALSFRDTYLTALTERSLCRAEIVVDDALHAGVPPAQIYVGIFQSVLASGGDLQQRLMLWWT
jgi:hypothetical protein